MRHALVFLIFICLTLMSSSCSAPPPPSVKIPTWQEAFAPKSVKKITNTHIHFEIWSTQPLTNSSQLETDLAATGLIADIEGSGTQRSISLGDTECAVQYQKAATQTRNDRLALCGEHLSADQIAQLTQSNHHIQVHCKGQGLASAIEGHNITVAITKSSPGVRIDLNQKHCSIVSKYNRFLSENFIRTQHIIHNNTMSMSTVGLKGFGFQEIMMGPLSSDRKKLAHDRLLSLADQILRIEGQAIGQSVQSGMSTAIYVPAEQAKSVIHIPPTFTQALLLVDPKAKRNDVKAQQKFNYRFTQP